VAVLGSIGLAPVILTVLDLPAGERASVATLVVLTGADVAITIVFSSRMAILRGLQRYDLYNGVHIFGAVLQGLAAVIVLEAGGTVRELIALNIPVNLAMRIAATASVRRIEPDLLVGVGAAEASAIRRLISYCCSAFTIDLAGRLHSRAAEFVIACFLPLSAVTPYALARRLGELISVAATHCVKAILPLASELEANDRRGKLRRLYIVSSRVTLAIAAPVTVVIAVSAGTLLTLWVGPAYAHAAPLVLILAAASLMHASQWPAAEILRGISRHHVVAWTGLLAGLASVILSIVLLPKWGLLGVALGTAIPTFIGSAFVVLPFVNRTLDVSWRTALQEIWIPGLAPAMPAAMVLWTLLQPEAAGMLAVACWSAVSALVYAGAYLAMPATAVERTLLIDVMNVGFRSVRRAALFRFRVVRSST
jgi:O-antigen/teichoic acid export membrane protein